MKKCFKCEAVKPLEDFYKHNRMADGHLNKCKECTKKDVSEKYKSNFANPDYVYKERKRGREKHRRLYSSVKRVYYGSAKKHQLKYPEKHDARLKSQHLKKPFDGAEKHHWSYNEEHYKDVIWLTKKQHMKAHRFIVYDQERKMYRRFDNNVLLDTKESHQFFINYCIENYED